MEFCIFQNSTSLVYTENFVALMLQEWRGGEQNKKLIEFELW